MARSGENLLALAFADQCRRWSRQLGAPVEAAQAAWAGGKAVAEAVAEGHVCLSLERGPLPFDLEALCASGVAGPPGAATPLILDGSARLYLARYFDAETRLARALLQLHHRLPPPPGAAARALLQALFPTRRAGEPDWQQLAVALALCRHLTIISGGPGTGKTTTVARLLACLLADMPDCRIALAAPTGKAAARLQESLRARAADLPADLAARLPQGASTLHRLLGLGIDGQAPRYHRDNPLPVDLLVVDEASMLDLSLALQMVEALPPQARLILLGDKDQLKAVEAGAVFAALSARPALSPATCAQLAALTGWPVTVLPRAQLSGPLDDAVVWLSRSHRFAADSALGRLAAALVRGQVSLAMDCLQNGGEELALVEASGPGLSPQEFQRLEAGYAPYRQALSQWQAGERDLAALFEAFDRYRILCATRRGERGVAAVNERLCASLRAPGRRVSPAPFAPSAPLPGQPLMILRNDPASQLFNGDIGIALEDEEGLGVYFPDGASAGARTWRRLAPNRLPLWETAFALTVHKSQGSEFAAVALLLPAQDSPLLTRELIYTAVTRARARVQVLARAELLQQAMARQVRREGGLAEQLGMSRS